MRRRRFLNSLIGVLALIPCPFAYAVTIDEIEMRSTKYPIFIEKKYAGKVSKALEFVNKTAKAEVIASIKALDYRGLHLTDDYQAVLDFSKQQNLRCKYGQGNFYSSNEIMGIAEYSFEDDETRDRVSQKVIYCHDASFDDFDPQHPANFEFTPLGRLYSISATLLSEESSVAAINRFKEKFPDRKWNVECLESENNGSCFHGQASSSDEHTALSIEFNDHLRSFKQEKYEHEYTVRISSKYLLNRDFLALRKTLNDTGPAKPTKF